MQAQKEQTVKMWTEDLYLECQNILRQHHAALYEFDRLPLNKELSPQDIQDMKFLPTSLFIHRHIFPHTQIYHAISNERYKAPRNQYKFLLSNTFNTFLILPDICRGLRTYTWHYDGDPVSGRIVYFIFNKICYYHYYFHANPISIPNPASHLFATSYTLLYSIFIQTSEFVNSDVAGLVVSYLDLV